MTGEPTLPVNSFREAAPFLRRPFTEHAVKFKVQATWDGGGLIVGYIDARLAVERLNLVCPHLWSDRYEPVAGSLMWCHLTLDGITRSDVGEGKGKGLVSDALKRAAVKFGVGVPLYAIPKMILKESDRHLKKNSQGKYELTPAGEQACRTRYAGWLDAHGKKAFGEALDHGDVEDALGDHEADAPAGVDTGAAVAKPLTTAQREKVEAAIADYSDEEQSLLLSSVGVAAVADLTVESARELRATLDARAQANGAPA